MACLASSEIFLPFLDLLMYMSKGFMFLQELQPRLMSHAAEILRVFSFFPEANKWCSSANGLSDHTFSKWFQRSISSPPPASMEAISMVWLLSLERDQAWTNIAAIFGYFTYVFMTFLSYSVLLLATYVL